MDKAKGCYTANIQQFMQSADGKVVDKFIDQQIFIKETLDVCTNKATQDRVSIENLPVTSYKLL